MKRVFILILTTLLLFGCNMGLYDTYYTPHHVQYVNVVPYSYYSKPLPPPPPKPRLEPRRNGYGNKYSPRDIGRMIDNSNSRTNSSHNRR